MHGGAAVHDLEQHLRTLLDRMPVALHYLRMPPSLVRQRNAGIALAHGDVVFFVDDDAVYLDGYAAAVLGVYDADSEGSVGGVQGTIANPGSPFATRSRVANLFLLTRLNGNGTLQASAWPAFCTARPGLAEVEVFSGPAMSFRRDVLTEFQFDDALAAYYIGDDFEMSYRVSRRHRLVPDTRGAADALLGVGGEGTAGSEEAGANGCGQPPVSQPKAPGRRMEDTVGVGVVRAGVLPVDRRVAARGTRLCSPRWDGGGALGCVARSRACIDNADDGRSGGAVRLLVTGAAGMLGSALCPTLRTAGHEVMSTDIRLHRPGNGRTRCARQRARWRPTAATSNSDGIMHLAAETSLEVCEADVEHAYLTNTVGTRNVAWACRDLGIPLVYISSVGVFDGTKVEPYDETRRAEPDQRLRTHEVGRGSRGRVRSRAVLRRARGVDDRRQ